MIIQDQVKSYCKTCKTFDNFLGNYFIKGDIYSKCTQFELISITNGLTSYTLDKCPERGSCYSLTLPP